MGKRWCNSTRIASASTKSLMFATEFDTRSGLISTHSRGKFQQAAPRVIRLRPPREGKSPGIEIPWMDTTADPDDVWDTPSLQSGFLESFSPGKKIAAADLPLARNNALRGAQSKSGGQDGCVRDWARKKNWNQLRGGGGRYYFRKFV